MESSEIIRDHRKSSVSHWNLHGSSEVIRESSADDLQDGIMEEKEEEMVPNPTLGQ